MLAVALTISTTGVMISLRSSSVGSPSVTPIAERSPAPAPAPPAAPERSIDSPFFARDSIWNSRLDAGALLDPNSDAYVAELRRQARPRSRGGFGSSIMTKLYGVPIYTVKGDAREVRVSLDKRNAPLLQEAFERVPMPAEARPADGRDANLAVWQPSTDTMWEFWHLSRRADGWHAEGGGKMTDVSKSPGRYRDRRDDSGELIERDHWGTTSAKFPLVAGVMTIEELEAGNIPHALNFAIPQARKDVWSWPAQGTDGRLDSAKAIPQGARFRIDPRIDLRTLGLPPVIETMARAAQRHGMVLVNTSGGVGFRAEDPTRYETNPYPALFGGLKPYELMSRFPWEHLQMLPLDLRRRDVEGTSRARPRPADRPRRGDSTRR